MKTILILPLLLLLSACATTYTDQPKPLVATEQLIYEAPQSAGNQQFMEQLYRSRTWVPYRYLSTDPIEVGKKVSIPVQEEQVKILGPVPEDALRSLALKIWLIEHAEHTVDVVYYIFKQDLVGQAMLGALCNAVKRGVDVRIMVDSIGSISITHSDLMALESCAEDAGYLRDAQGRPTPLKARVQAAVFNAITSTTAWINRRSHDKLLVIDGAFPQKATVITGGRNISLDYYGITEDGQNDPAAYRDLEILLRPNRSDSFDKLTVGNVSEIYYSLLFLHKGNRRLRPVHPDYQEDYVFLPEDIYREQREQAQQSLEKLKSFPLIAQYMQQMPAYLETGFHLAEVRLAHELANLTNRNVVTRATTNLAQNPNSIMFLLDTYSREMGDGGQLKVVSPYMFLARYYDKDGKVLFDGVSQIHEWLKQHPDNRVELITNSVLTSDNFLAQSIIDMDMAPRLLLTPEQQNTWVSSLEAGELSPALVDSETWKQSVSNPQIFIYQTGRLDAALLGQGDAHYGKLHAKFVMDDKGGFVGTANFDYRSRLFNNELGFFYESDDVNQDMNAIFDKLKASSYRWGSEDWLKMRKAVMEVKGIKGWSTRQQRFIFKFMRATGLDWLI